MKLILHRSLLTSPIMLAKVIKYKGIIYVTRVKLVHLEESKLLIFIQLFIMLQSNPVNVKLIPLTLIIDISITVNILASTDLSEVEFEPKMSEAVQMRKETEHMRKIDRRSLKWKPFKRCREQAE